MKGFALCAVVVIVAAAMLCAGAILVPLVKGATPLSAVYDGSLQEFFDGNAPLLREAAEILWQHPDFFEQWRGGPNSDDSMFTAWYLRWGKVDPTLLTDAEWQTIRRLFDEPGACTIGYDYGPIPWVYISLVTSEEGHVCLQATPAAMAWELRSRAQYHARFELIGLPGWYAGTARPQGR